MSYNEKYIVSVNVLLRTHCGANVLLKTHLTQCKRPVKDPREQCIYFLYIFFSIAGITRIIVKNPSIRKDIIMKIAILVDRENPNAIYFICDKNPTDSKFVSEKAFHENYKVVGNFGNDFLVEEI